MTQYKIYYANLAKATGVLEKKTRPVILLGNSSYGVNFVRVLQVTSRMREEKFYSRLNNFIVSGFVECKHIMNIDRKYLLNFVRETTISEKEGIDKKLSEFKTK